MNRYRWTGVVCVLALLLGAAWALGWLSGEDAEVAALRVQMESRDQLSDADRQALRERIGSLSDNQRRQLFEPMRGQFGAGMRDRLAHLQSLSTAERRKELDTWIDEMEARSRERQSRGDVGGPPGGFGDMSPADRERRMKGMLDRTTPEMRATVDQLMTMVNERREQRGLKPLDSPRGLFGGGRRPQAMAHS